MNDKAKTGLWKMEKAFWLEGVEAYLRDMAPHAVMLFPPPAGLMAGDEILGALAKAPRWEHVSMTERLRTYHSDAVVTLAYRTQALRAGVCYEAYCSSCYIRAGGAWKLIQHQQTPIAAE